MSSRLKLFVPLGLFVLLAVLLFRGLSLDPQELPSALIDKPLPGFKLPALQTQEMLSDADLVGKPALLNVWATWCISCRVEHPYLQRLADEGVLIYGLNYKDDSVAARSWLDSLGDPYRASVVDADGTLGLDLGVYGAPETYFIDANGVIRYRHVGVIDERIWTGRLKAVYDALAAATDS
ncbi:DsbE family thiol:disulfide interchange protein [Congregibacter variabilis]|uniref:DsbE family thiol:disulfide interchange protein n=1 Tax=Congregibacter variabilis TaxID=3081200 RepID=A0ABZ0I464_9GAMM|nr:DsbE family thiol:disulfide interchange protein [Congregibacter sp. IMCC43200]